MTFEQKVAVQKPMATNVTANGIERSGLRSGDYIRSNNSVNGKIDFICGDIITITTLKGNLLNITSDNTIDLIY